jgi:hypothetical protein
LYRAFRGRRRFPRGTWFFALLAIVVIQAATVFTIFSYGYVDGVNGSASSLSRPSRSTESRGARGVNNSTVNLMCREFVFSCTLFFFCIHTRVCYNTLLLLDGVPA